MGDAASVNSFRDRGLYPFCAQAVLDLADQGQLVAQPVNRSHLWHTFPI